MKLETLVDSLSDFRAERLLYAGTPCPLQLRKSGSVALPDSSPPVLADTYPDSRSSDMG